MANQHTIGLLVEGRYLSQSQPAGMMRALQAKGQTVVPVDPVENFHRMGDNEWLKGLDLIVARGRSHGLFCLLSWAESFGVTTINSKASIGAVFNKAEMAVALAAGGVKTPTTYFAGVKYLASRVPRDDYPIILKPIFGDNSQGLLVVDSPEEMEGVEWREPVALAQHYHPGDGYDLKLYAIGGDVWAVRKPSPFNPSGDGPPPGAQAQSVALTDDLRQLAHRCGEISGLELFGVDCIETPGGPLVIEINDFPNYTGVPQADERLADYVIDRAAAGRSERP